VLVRINLIEILAQDFYFERQLDRFRGPVQVAPILPRLFQIPLCEAGERFMLLAVPGRVPIPGDRCQGRGEIRGRRAPRTWADVALGGSARPRAPARRSVMLLPVVIAEPIQPRVVRGAGQGGQAVGRLVVKARLAELYLENASLS